MIKQTYAKRALTEALLKLLKDKDITHISVSELADEAQVSRVTFYRNYKTLEDVLQAKVQSLLTDWHDRNKESFDEDKAKNNRNDLQLSSLFGHLLVNAEVYDRLYEQELLHLIIPSLKIFLTPQEMESNFAAYLESFTIYGLYGWILEWFHRGKQESAEQIEIWLRQRVIG